MKNLVYEIKLEASKLYQKNEEELNSLIERIKNRVKKESLDDLLIEWFALVQEISFRKIGLRHFDTQLVGGILLHQGKIVEMKTGEGKTLVSTLPVSLNALTSKGAHVVTVNDYLAERDQKWMGKVYKGLGLSVGLVKPESSLKEKQKNYNSDITYITNSELVFDYLRDSSAYNITEIVQRPFNFCLIDEIDSILIDESRTPLILSVSKGIGNLNKLALAKAVANELANEIHFQLDEKRKDINLTDLGYKKAKKRLGQKTLYDYEDPWMLDLLNALKAKYLFKLNKDYIILNNKIVIVDEFTGRIMEDRRWSMGLHQAIESKENVKVGEETKTKTSITYQNFFTLYPTLSGMTGTAKTTEREFKDIYNLPVRVLDTVKPLLRKDFPDLVYQNELAKWKAVLIQSKKCFERGQPILIGTATIEKSEFLSELFKLSKIPHQVLNAKPENVTRESEIVAQAGRLYGVTIATNMAGRGTDIILGGNPVFQVKEKIQEGLRKKEEKELENTHELFRSPFFETIYSDYQKKKKLPLLQKDIENLPYSLDTCEKSLQRLYKELYTYNYKAWEKENQEVKKLGGLFVLGTERHETRRIDNQLRGRAGRQGDPGMSQFFVSLEDELIKIFGGDSIKRWLDYLIEDENTPLESDLLTKSLEKAQEKVELYNYEVRKNIFQYDNILNIQRKQLFKVRKEILTSILYEPLFRSYIELSLDEKVDFPLQKKEEKMQRTLELNFNPYFFYGCKFISEKRQFFLKKKISKSKKKMYKELWISKDLRFAEFNFYQFDFLKDISSLTFLSILDFYWTEHIERMGYIRDTIAWRSYGQQNPLMEYNKEAVDSFKGMFEQIRSSMIYYLLNNPLLY